MGLLKCPDCGKEFSDRIDACPNCSCPKSAILEELETKKEPITKAQEQPNSNTDLFSPIGFAEAKKRMCALRTVETERTFYKIFAEIVESSSWVSAPANNQQLVLSPFRGGYYIAIYSDMNGRVAGDSKDVITTDINKFIDVLYDNPRLLGIVIDPNKDPFLIHRKTIHKLTTRKDPRLEQKDWGTGIPQYTEKDLMSEEELLDFGMDIVNEHYITKNGFTILETNKGMNAFPNYALQKNGVIYLMKVAVGVTNKPSLTPQSREFYLSSCKRFNAKCLYAPVALTSGDEERAAKGIALYGDGYYALFSDVEELN